MTINVVHPTLFLLLLTLVLSAAERSSAQTSDLSLRLPGDAVDSITGGPPTVMIRALTKKDYAYPRINAITFDPVLSLFYLNAGYEQGLNNWFTLGGRLQVPIGILGSEETKNIWAVGADARFYLDREGAKDFFARVAPKLYFGSRTVTRWDEEVGEDVTGDIDILIPSVHVEGGWRVIWFNRVVCDWTLGIERAFGDPEDLSDVIFVWIGSSPIQVSGSLRLGWTW